MLSISLNIVYSNYISFLITIEKKIVISMNYLVELDDWKGKCAPLGLVVDIMLPECC